MEPRSRETTPTKEDLDFIVDDGYRHDEDPDYVPNEKYVVTGPEFKRLTRNAKKLGAESLDYSTRKNNKYMATLPGGKKVHFGSPKYPDYTIHKDKERRDKYRARATKIKNKQGELTYTNPESSNYWKKIIFNEAKEYKVKDSKIKYKRIPIEVKYPNGKKGALVLESPVLFSFGVNEKKNQETGKLVGYSIPVCLWAKDSEPNNKEKAFFDVINNVTTLSQQHLENEYRPDLASTLSSPFYYKQIEYTDKKGKKRTKVDESSAPVLYAKLIYSEKSRKILSLFKGKGGRDLNPFKSINQYCNVKLALIIEGIFISKTVTSLQIKVHECYVKQLEPRKSLLTIDEKSSDSDSDSDSDSKGEEITDQVVEDLILSDEETK
ncbi:unnamed protein product [Porites lobata]|uniref:Uncharacterized protein n=1 Tax=Porites lobata TaxID=104759 RepID=A0ABN8RBX6_9CNID|nr:unnamed protein product [Porites lobata]